MYDFLHDVYELYLIHICFTYYPVDLPTYQDCVVDKFTKIELFTKRKCLYCKGTLNPIEREDHFPDMSNTNQLFLRHHPA